MSHASFDPSCVAEVIVTYGGGRRHGSGYRVSAEAVLTAAHVLKEAERVQVRFRSGLPDECEVLAASWLTEAGSGVAVIAIDPCAGEPPAESPSFGRLGDHAASVGAQVVGFPWWKMRETDSAEGARLRYRDTHHADATVSTLSNWREGTLELVVRPVSTPTRREQGKSRWEGMSGAAVWVNGHIVGVVTTHHGGEEALTAARLDRLESKDLHTLQGLLPFPRYLPDATLAPKQAERLGHYLRAISRIDDEHPHPHVRTQAPPLSKIYLQRQASKETDDDEEAGLHTLERLPADQLLKHHEGVQVVGAPGMGKSSLIRRLAASEATRLLEEQTGDYVPVPIPARALHEAATLPDALANGVSQVPGAAHRLDHAQLVRLFRSNEPMPGMRWLVLVDGIDEILDRGSRREAFNKISQHRDDSSFRFLITSRPADQDQFSRQIDVRTYPTYSLEPFSTAELQEFAKRFLDEQQHPAPIESAADFVTRADRTALAALARVPLTATMLCTLYAENHKAELPNNQSQLYGQFVEWLLIKLKTSDARAQLLSRVAAHGPNAESAINQLIENIEDLLQGVALKQIKNGSTERGLSVLDQAESWGRVQPPSRIQSADWRDILLETLRLTGVVIQTGHQLEFLHKTLAEYLAACHLATHYDPRTRVAKRLLAPNTSWPPFEVKIFLAARWNEDTRANLTHTLTALLRWGRWRRNIDFIAELHRHGLELDRRLVQRAVRILCKSITNPKTSNRAWRESVSTLNKLEPLRAANELEGLATSSSDVVSEPRRFLAVRELASLAPDRAPKAVEHFLGEADIDRATIATLARRLRELDWNQAIVIFDQVASQIYDDTRRVEVAIILADHLSLEHGVQSLSALAHDQSLDDNDRVKAARSLLERDSERGLTALCRVCRSVTRHSAFSQGTRAVLNHDTVQARTLLTELAYDQELEVVLRFVAAQLLVENFSVESDLLLELASSRNVDKEDRLLAAMHTDGDHDTRVEIVRDVIAYCDHGDPYRLTALEELVKLDKQAGYWGLTAIAKDRRKSDNDRQRALEIASECGVPHDTEELFGIIALDASVNGVRRIELARAASRVDRFSGMRLIAKIADDSRASAETRIDAALILAGHDTTQGVEALVKIGRTRSLSAEYRLNALEAAYKRKPRAPQDALADFASERGVSDPLQLRAAMKVRHKKTAERLLLNLSSSKHLETRFEAACSLARVNQAQGCSVLRTLEADQRVSKHWRKKAGQTANRLER